MSVPRKFDAETWERAVRMDHEGGVAKFAGRYSMPGPVVAGSVW